MTTARTTGLRVLFVGGGTGGHISPGLAIAERLADLDPDGTRGFICSERPIDATMLDEAGARWWSVPAVPPARSPRPGLRFLIAFRRSTRAVREIIEREGIDEVISLGGFVAAPSMSAGFRSPARVTLLNLDAVPGKASRWWARRCDRVWSAVPLPARGRLRVDEVVGMPVRRRALKDRDPLACRAALGLAPQCQTLLVTGASQGAHSINQLMQALVTTRADVFDRWQILHLAGQADVDDLQAAYRAADVAAVVLPFVHQMGLAWGAADLAISRAGANSVAEVAMNAVPTIFLPYPYHRDTHQRANAMPLTEAGGAVIVEDRIEPAATLQQSEAEILDLLASESRRAAMRAALERARPTDAAQRIAELLLKVRSA